MSNENLIIPALKNDALLNDIKKAQTEYDVLHLWWLGQSGYLVQWNNSHLLIDPYLSDSLTKKYAHTDKPHIRMTELVISPEKLDFIDVVTSSHNHTDHLDGETLIPLLKVNPEISFVIPEANRQFVADRVKCNPGFPIGMNDGVTKKVKGITITGIPAAHEDLERDESGNSRFLGYIFDVGGNRIYHSGDTLWFEDMVEVLQPHQVDIAILPVNGRDPKRKVAGNLNGEQAARLGKAIGVSVVIPCHYDMFTFNTADPNEFAKEAEKIDQSYSILQCGERFSFS